MINVLTISRRTGWEEIAQKSLAAQTMQDFEWIVVSEQPLSIPYIPAPPKTKRSNLNASLNLGLKNCSSEYVIFYQDFIELPPDCFEKLINYVDNNTFVTTLTINPPDIEKDPRGVVGGPVRECRPEEWEANVASAPMGIIRYLGGFDEDYDNGWSWDNCNLAVRAAMLGCNFLIDQANNPRLMAHDKSDIHKLNGDFHAQRMADIEAGKFPLRLKYL